MNGTKSFLLITALTGLMVGIGFLWQGEMGVIIGLGIGLFANAISYFFSDRIVLASPRPVVSQQAPELTPSWPTSPAGRIAHAPGWP